MNTSSFELLRDPKVVVLSAGHGGSEPGACDEGYKERDQAIYIVDRVAELLRNRGISVEVVPHDKGLSDGIKWVNQHFEFGEAWAIEIHRDSADGLTLDDASRRCGVYYGTSDGSKAVGHFICKVFEQNGAHSNTWARPDTACRYGSLAWIRQTKPLAHLLELGFMQGKNDNEHLNWLAELAASAIYEAFTGQPLPVEAMA